MTLTKKQFASGVDADLNPVYREVVSVVGLGGGPAGVSQSIPDSSGLYSLNPDALAQAITYNGPNGAVDTITAGPDANGNSFRQTLGYTGAKVTLVSAWTKV